MYKNIFCIICLFLFLNVTFSQSKVNVDSLIQICDRYNKEDTLKLKMIYQLIPELRNKDMKKALQLNDESIRLAEKLNIPFYKAKSNFFKSYLYISDGKYNDANDLLQQVLLVFEKLKRTKETGDVYNLLGAIANQKKENSLAIDYYEKAIFLFNSCKDLDAFYSTKDMLASVYGLTGDIKKALEMNNDAIRYFEKKNMKLQLANSLRNKARYHYNLGEMDISVETTLKSLKIHEEIGNLNAQVFIYQNLAVIFNTMDNPQKAIDYAKKGLKLNEQLKNKRVEIGLNNVICHALSKQNEYKNAIICYEKVIKAFEESNDLIGAAENSAAMATVLLSEKQFSHAFRNYQYLLTLYEKTNNLVLIPDTYYKIGNLIPNIPDSSLLSCNILPQSKYSESLKYLEKGLKIAKDNKDLNNQKLINYTISRNYEDQKKYAEAYDAYKQYISLKDSISGDEVQKKITKSELQYEYDKKELALKYEKQLTEKQLANQLLLTNQQKQVLRLNEQALTLSNQEKDLTHLAFLKEQAEKQEKTQQLALAEEREKTKEQDLALKNIQLTTQKKQNLYLGGFIFVLLLGLGTLIYFYQILKKQKNIISQQNQLNEHTISILSHDIKEPLLGVKLLLKKLHVHDPFLSQASLSLENQVHAVNGVLNNLLRMRKAAITESTSNQNANVNDIIHNVIKDLTFNLESKGLFVENQLKDHFTLPIAPEKLQIVIHNIMSNAIKYSHPDQSIKIYRDGNGFCIQDYGVGLSDVQTLNLMSDVKNSKPGTTQEKGYGMGLFLVGMLLKGEQVSVIFESPEIGGTIVKIMG